MARRRSHPGQRNPVLSLRSGNVGPGRSESAYRRRRALDQPEKSAGEISAITFKIGILKLWLGAWLRLMERETGIEPATSSLGSWRSTAELLPLRLANNALNDVSLPPLPVPHNRITSQGVFPQATWPSVTDKASASFVALSKSSP